MFHSDNYEYRRVSWVPGFILATECGTTRNDDFLKRFSVFFLVFRGQYHSS